MPQFAYLTLGVNNSCRVNNSCTVIEPHGSLTSQRRQSGLPICGKPSAGFFQDVHHCDRSTGVLICLLVTLRSTRTRKGNYVMKQAHSKVYQTS